MNCFIRTDQLNMETTGKVWIFYNIKTQQKTQSLSHEKAQLFILDLTKHEMRYIVAWTPGWKKWIPVKEILKSESSYFPLPPATAKVDTNSEFTLSKSGRPNSKSEKSNPRQETITNTQSGDARFERTYTEVQLSSSTTDHQKDFLPDAVNWENTPVLPLLKKNLESDMSEDERREYRRFPHRIEIVIMTRKGKSFRSSSANISLGGVLLREAIPSEILNDAMDLVIVNPFPDSDTPSHLMMKCKIVGDTKNKKQLMFFDVTYEIQTQLYNILDKYKKNYQAHKKKRAA